MSHKNKKIKSKCHHCGQMNKYKAKQWKGREHTRCKQCGEILAIINTECKEVKKNKMITNNNYGMSPGVYEAIRPVRNQEGVIKSGSKKKWWALVGVVLIILLGCGYIYQHPDSSTSKLVMAQLTSARNNSIGDMDWPYPWDKDKNGSEIDAKKLNPNWKTIQEKTFCVLDPNKSLQQKQEEGCLK